jgi:hypothetical protein
MPSHNIFTSVNYNTIDYSAQGAIVKYKFFKKDPTRVPAANQFAIDDEKGKDDLPLLMMSISLSFQRRISKQYPINTAANKATQVNLSSAPIGQLQVSSIFSPNPKELSDFIYQLSQGCSDKECWLLLQPFGNQCTGNTVTTTKKSASYLIGGVILEQMGLTIQGGETASIDQPLVFSFNELVLEHI